MGGNHHGRPERFQPRKIALYQRAQEAIDFLMECDGRTQLSKQDFAVVMSQRHGRAWLKSNGDGDRQLVSDICNLTRDQGIDLVAERKFQGYVIAYSPSIGGMVLFDPSGELSFESMLFMLAGDMQRQSATATINRRRVSYWNAAGHQAINAGEADLGRLCFQIEREIESTGFAADSLVADFLSLVGSRAPGGAPVL